MRPLTAPRRAAIASFLITVGFGWLAVIAPGAAATAGDEPRQRLLELGLEPLNGRTPPPSTDVRDWARWTKEGIVVCVGSDLILVKSYVHIVISRDCCLPGEPHSPAPTTPPPSRPQPSPPHQPIQKPSAPTPPRETLPVARSSVFAASVLPAAQPHRRKAQQVVEPRRRGMFATLSVMVVVVFVISAITGIIFR